MKHPIDNTLFKFFLELEIGNNIVLLCVLLCDGLEGMYV